ncbi:MAG: hypothetical protein JJU13_00650 [Balneolaceae bacterium]|nr:hypothetical protein [Balneolaceae bacterium]
MSLPKVGGTVLWLLPGRDCDELFTDIIQKLARRYDAPIFMPHITIGRVPDWEPEKIIHAIDVISENTSRFSMPVKTVHCKNHPYQKISVETEPVPGFETLLGQINHQFCGEYGKREYPHLSLLYSKLPCSRLQDKVVRLRSKMPDQIHLYQLAYISVSGTPEQWHVIHSCSLKEVSQV